jgi:DNA-binding transcriptional regulator LsrR (DeoR family)
MRRLRPAEVDELVTAYEHKVTVRALAERFGINRTTVSMRLRGRA